MQGIHLLNKWRRRRPVYHELSYTVVLLGHARSTILPIQENYDTKPASRPSSSDHHDARVLCLSYDIPEPSREIMFFHNIHNLTLRRTPTFNPIPPCILEPVVQRHAHSDKDAEGVEGDVQ